jgi:hypothetical protein
MAAPEEGPGTTRNPLIGLIIGFRSEPDRAITICQRR